MKLKSIKDNFKAIEGRKVFLRVDFNVPLRGGKIKDEAKIIAAMSTIRFLLRYKCRIMMATHLGDPNGKNISSLSVKPLVKRLSTILENTKIEYVNQVVGEKVKKAWQKIKPGQILFLENLRFEAGEEKNDNIFAKKLASLSEVYVNEAFSVCHRAHASVAAIRKFLPSFAGLTLKKEIESFDKVKNPNKPLVMLMGGAKIKTKINLIKNLEPKTENILIGGALANNFFRALNMETGKSLIDKESVVIAKRLIKNKKIILPLDVVVESRKGIKVKVADEVGKSDVILDIGPQTIRYYADIIKKAATIVWNGPLGAFEKPHFKHGTVAVGQMVAARSRGRAFGVVGGGETLEALKMTGMEGYIDWVSTGGGAMLAYLGGERMPGL